MADTNLVLQIGRVTRDAEFKISGTTNILSYSIAVNGYKENDVSYFDCVSFGKLAEVMHKYIVKGKQIAITGRLQQNRWEQDGQKRNKIQIIGENIQLLGAKTAKTEKAEKTEGPSNNEIPF